MMLAYDSVEASAIPADAALVIGWGDGAYRWSAADWARFSTPFKQTVVYTAADDGDWLDIEHGDASAADAPGWVQRQRERPVWPGGLYTYYANWANVRLELAAAGVVCRRWWIAYELGRLPESAPPISAGWLAAGVVLWQFAQSPGISPGHYDMSSIAPGYLPAGPPPPAPFRPEEVHEMNGPVFDVQGKRHYSGLVAAENPDGTPAKDAAGNPTFQVVTWEETAPGSAQWTWRALASDTTNGAPPNLSA